MQGVDPKVAYYCRLWAVDQVRRRGQARTYSRIAPPATLATAAVGHAFFCCQLPSAADCGHALNPPQALKIQTRHKEINGLLGAVMSQLENDKPRVGALDPDNDK